MFKQRSNYRGTLVFDLLPIRTIRFFDQKIPAKNASELEQNFAVRTLGLGTEKSRVESESTPRLISRERKEPSGAETHSADRFLIKMD